MWRTGAGAERTTTHHERRSADGVDHRNDCGAKDDGRNFDNRDHPGTDHDLGHRRGGRAGRGVLPLLDTYIAEQQRMVDIYADMSLEDLATLPEAPSLFMEEGEIIQGTFVPTGEESPELLERIALRERCYLDLFFTPILSAARVDQKSPAGAIAWSAGQLNLLLYMGPVLSSGVGRERFGDHFDESEPEQPILPTTDVATCDALEQVVLEGVQSGIDTASWSTSEYYTEVTGWEEAIAGRAAVLGCESPFVARTIVKHGHTLGAMRWFELRSRALIVSQAWFESWESFRP